jgi:zinc transporter
MITLPEIAVFAFDGHGGAHSIEPGEAGLPAPEADEHVAFTWVHLRRDSEQATAFLQQSALDQFVIDALTAEETRPRCTVHGDGVVLNLRGINLNPGAEPEDMVSVRFWIEEQRVIGVSVRPMTALGDLLSSIERQRAPTTPGELIANVTIRISDRAEPIVAELNERLDVLEEMFLRDRFPASRHELASIRRVAIRLRRYLVPQRDALTTFEIEDVDWLHERDRSRIREAADRVTRLGEELDAIRDRAQIMHDQIMDRRSAAMNRNMLLLSIVAAVFLPLSLITGLLGINVGGIPGATSPIAFWVVCALLVVIAVLQVLIFRRFGMFK